MLRTLNAMKGWAVEATDGDIGTVADFQEWLYDHYHPVAHRR